MLVYITHSCCLLIKRSGILAPAGHFFSPLNECSDDVIPPHATVPAEEQKHNGTLSENDVLQPSTCMAITVTKTSETTSIKEDNIDHWCYIIEYIILLV